MSSNLRDFLKGYCRELLVGLTVKKCDHLPCLHEWGRIEVRQSFGQNVISANLRVNWKTADARSGDKICSGHLVATRWSILTMVEFVCSIPSLKTFTEVPKITAWNSYQLMNLMRGKDGEEMQIIINYMGELSAIAQGLRGPITSVDRLLQSFQKIYLLTSSVPGNSGHILAQGILKVGQKHLFIRRTPNAPLVEISPLCVLDFYVHESYQRQGLGHMLFRSMLEQEKKRPCQLGYDKPSNKLLSFMSKYYNLRSYNDQANQFVVYNDYFVDAKNEAQKEKENRDKELNGTPDIGTNPRKDEVLHDSQANLQVIDVDDQCSSNRSDISRLTTAEARPPNLHVKEPPKQPLFRGGRKKIWQSKQGYSEKPPNSADTLHTTDARSSLQSPTKATLSLKDAYRQGLNDQGISLHARKSSNSLSSEPKRCQENHGANNLHEPGVTLLYSVIGEEERLKIQSMCTPSLAQKMNVKHPTRANHKDPKPIKPRPNMGSPVTRPTRQLTQKDPPPSCPLWADAKELSESQHWQERNPVDYKRTGKVCC